MTAVQQTVPQGWSSGPDTGVPAAIVPALILGRARQDPDAVAVRQWDDRISYRELVLRAGRLADTLRTLGAGPETRVGVCMSRRPDMVVAVLGVLLAGAAYVPLDVEQPRSRLVDIAADAAAGLVVVDGAGRDRLADHAGGTLRLVEVSRQSEPGASPPSPGPARPEHAAYVLYTSGSTGRPKGVVVTHRSVTAFTTGLGRYLQLDHRSCSFGFAPLGFDVSVIDLLVPLVTGGRIALVPDVDRRDPDRLHRFVTAHQVTWGSVPPVLLPLLDPDRLPHWRVVMTGGEAPTSEQVARWSRHSRRFVNCYGTTETTVGVTALDATGWAEPSVPIGRPLANQSAYVVDGRLRPTPVGVPGELLIGGAGLARGYLGDPALTAERFIADPFGAQPGARLYRTGDLACWRPDGTLAFLGRLDRQVKIRGQRIEPGEIEATLRAHPQVRQAAVEAVAGAGGTDLVAFLVPADPTVADTLPELIRAYCADRLPPAMLPARIRCLDALPLTGSDKVDSLRLRALDAAAMHGARGEVARGELETPTQRTVGTVWCDVLGSAATGPEDDFFAVGGHSIAAMRLAAALRTATGRAVEVEDVFLGRTLRGVAERVDRAGPDTGAQLPSGSPPALSAAQRRLWFVDQLAGVGAAAYNTAMAQRLRGPLDVAALRAALRSVAARHEVLRWRLPERRGVPYVVCDPLTDVPLPVQDVAQIEAPDRDSALRHWLGEVAAAPFDLAAGPLWRARLLRLDPGGADHVLAITVHHAVFDGWSAQVLYRDLADGYAVALSSADTTPSATPVTFADYVAWRQRRDERRGGTDLAWWTGHLRGAPTVLDLPRDHARPPEQTYSGRRVQVELPTGCDGVLRAVAQCYAATPATVLLAAFGELLHRLTGRCDVVVGAPVADRRQPEFAGLVGFFVDIVPIRLTTSQSAGPDTFADQIRRCRQELLDVLAHPAAPLERIVAAAGLPRDASRAPLVQVLFNVFNFTEPRLALSRLRCEPVPAGLPGSPFDLTLYVIERDGHFGLDVVYNPDLYAPQRIDRLVSGYLGLLEGLLAAPGEPVADVVLPGTAELAAGTADAAGPVPAARVPQPGFADPVPATDTERTLARLCVEAFELTGICMTENFFDAGATSMAMAALRVRLVEQLERDVRLVDLFLYPTVRELARHLDGAAEGADVDRAKIRAVARRAAAQRRRTGRGRPGRGTGMGD